MAEEDYEIDFYGDSEQPQAQQHQKNAREETHNEGDYHEDQEQNGNHSNEGHHQQDTESQYEQSREHEQDDRRQSQDQGRDGEDRGPVDPGATTALMISELNWWTTDDDIRGWLREGGCEDGVKDMTFNEHKVNGKSKGQTYIEFSTPQYATAAKHTIDNMSADGGQLGHKKLTTQYWNPNINPFRTLPKDAPTRGKDQGRTTGAYNERGGNYGGGFRGRGGYGPRGNMNQNNFNNRNFNSGGGMGFNANNGNMGGFGGPNGGGNFGFNNRGNMMGGGMRGGGMRGRGGNMMNMNPMGGMNMGMPGGMNMGMMGPGGMPGFQGMPGGFNGNWFGPNQGGGGGGNAGGGDWGNPHGAKRPRPE